MCICQLQAHRGCQCVFASCKPTGDVNVYLPVASPQGMSMCICQLQAHRGCQCVFASCKLTGDVSVYLPVASPQLALYRDVNVELIVHKPTEGTQSNTIVLVTIATHQHLHTLYLLLFILEVAKQEKLNTL